MIKSIHHNPTKFQIEINKFYRFEKHLVELEGKLLDGTIYQVRILATKSLQKRIMDEINTYSLIIELYRADL